MKYFVIILIAVSLLYSCNSDSSISNSKTDSKQIKLYVVALAQCTTGMTPYWNFADTLVVPVGSDNVFLDSVNSYIYRVNKYNNISDNFIIIYRSTDNSSSIDGIINHPNDYNYQRIVIQNGEFYAFGGQGLWYSIGTLKEIK
jgi:hypothetical protein